MNADRSDRERSLLPRPEESTSPEIRDHAALPGTNDAAIPSPASTELNAGMGDSSSFDSLGPVPSLPEGSECTPNRAAHEFPPGHVLLEFQIQRVLGRGAFGTVYLALHLSLNRFVALKVAQDLGAEGRTMARLEHRNVVQVYSEHRIREQGLRLLCLQFVPGPSLQDVIEQLHSQSRLTGWTGAEYLRIVDDNVKGPAILETGQIEERSRILTADFVTCVCLLGAELADGLSFAHAAGVVHRDLKPANILLNAYGRPLLADFNLAEEQTEAGRLTSLQGGTLAYMAPEQLRAFRDGTRHATDTVREPADLYALGLILLQLLTGKNESLTTALQAISQRSRNEFVTQLITLRELPSPLVASLPCMSDGECALAKVLSRALHPEVPQRTASAVILRNELQGCQRLQSVCRHAGTGGRILAAARRWPLAVFAALVLIPHVVGSAVNIAYNVVRVPELPLSASRIAAQETGGMSVDPSFVMQAFRTLTSLYNVFVWPLCLVLIVSLIGRNLAALRGRSAESPQDEADRRRQLIRVPGRLAIIAAVGWAPGLVVFPLGLWLMAGIRPGAATLHFAVNLLMSGSIALSYSYVGVTWLIVTSLYPRQWSWPAELNSATTIEELNWLTRPLGWCLTMAGLIPLLSAMLIVVTSPSQMPNSDYTTFRVLLTSLIALGTVGYHAAGRVIRGIQRTAARYAASDAEI